jgi:hypothetical protein
VSKNKKEYVVRGCVELTIYDKIDGKIIIENTVKYVDDSHADFFRVNEVLDVMGILKEFWAADFQGHGDAQMFVREKEKEE